LAFPGNAQNYTDDELIARYRATADNRWLGTLLDRYTLLLLGVAMKYLKDRTLAEDAVQQVFLKALTHFPAAPVANFKGWLYVLMRNHCLQLLRDKTYTAPAEMLETVPGNEGELEHKQLEEYTLSQMDSALDELNPEQKEVIVLFYLKKHSYEQITRLTGFNFMQVKSYIQNGKRNLKTILLKKINAYK